MRIDGGGKDVTRFLTTVRRSIEFGLDHRGTTEDASLSGKLRWGTFAGKARHIRCLNMRLNHECWIKRGTTKGVRQATERNGRTGDPAQVEAI